jgi:hypothetical protein
LRGGGDFEKKFLQSYTKKTTALTNWGKKYPAPAFGGGKKLQNSMVAGINLTSPRRSAGLIFRDYCKVNFFLENSSKCWK